MAPVTLHIYHSEIHSLSRVDISLYRHLGTMTIRSVNAQWEWRQEIGVLFGVNLNFFFKLGKFLSGKSRFRQANFRQISRTSHHQSTIRCLASSWQISPKFSPEVPLRGGHRRGGGGGGVCHCASPWNAERYVGEERRTTYLLSIAAF